MAEIGISGMVLAVPHLRVDLDDWCHWFDNNKDKIRTVVGHSYRLPGPVQNVYTMAANAVMRLIEQYNIDPRRIGFLAFGTESSTDNSAGAVIIKGMVDQVLRQLGLPAVSRNCEVPEYKHACLGGIYALKNAIRYLAHDGLNKLAVVVSGDVAKYRSGSSGEPTQGAGAVAMVLEAKPKMMSFDLAVSGNSSRYRGLDFRKPFSRFLNQEESNGRGYVSDFPLVNGKYSATCYMDAVLAAMEDMFERRNITDRASYFRNLRILFMHRPYHRMPQSSWGFAYLFALGRGSESDLAELEGYCTAAKVDLDSLLSEMTNSMDFFENLEGQAFPDPYPIAMTVLRAFRKTGCYQKLVEEPMRLGEEIMKNLGNLYAAALPAWMVAGLSQAAGENRELAGKEMLIVGYGSGDAAEVIPAKISPEWREAANLMDIQKAMQNPTDLTQAQYESLHQTGDAEGLPNPPSNEFVVSHTGVNDEGPIQDLGIEYYQYTDG